MKSQEHLRTPAVLLSMLLLLIIFAQHSHDITEIIQLAIVMIAVGILTIIYNNSLNRQNKEIEELKIKIKQLESKDQKPQEEIKGSRENIYNVLNDYSLTTEDKKEKLESLKKEKKISEFDYNDAMSKL